MTIFFFPSTEQNELVLEYMALSFSLINFHKHIYRIFKAFFRGDEWSLRAFASMPSTAIFLRARAEIKKLLCELASNAKIGGARASEHSFKFCEQIEQR